MLWGGWRAPALERGDDFGAAKLATARFYAARMLPETSALARQVTAGKATLMELPDRL